MDLLQRLRYLLLRLPTLEFEYDCKIEKIEKIRKMSFFWCSNNDLNDEWLVKNVDREDQDRFNMRVM